MRVSLLLALLLACALGSASGQQCSTINAAYVTGAPALVTGIFCLNTANCTALGPACGSSCRYGGLVCADTSAYTFYYALPASLPAGLQNGVSLVTCSFQATPTATYCTPLATPPVTGPGSFCEAGGSASAQQVTGCVLVSASPPPAVSASPPPPALSASPPPTSSPPDSSPPPPRTPPPPPPPVAPFPPPPPPPPQPQPSPPFAPPSPPAPPPPPRPPPPSPPQRPPPAPPPPSPSPPAPPVPPPAPPPAPPPTPPPSGFEAGLLGLPSLAFRGTAAASSADASFAAANRTIIYPTNLALAAQWRALCGSDADAVFSTAAGDASATLVITLPAPAAVAAVQLWRGAGEPAWPAAIDVRVLPSAASPRSGAPCCSFLNGSEADSLAARCAGAGGAVAVTARGGGPLRLCALFVFGSVLQPPPPVLPGPPPPPKPAAAAPPPPKPLAWYWVALIVVVTTALAGLACEAVVRRHAGRRREELARAAAMREALWKGVEMRAPPQPPGTPLPPSRTNVAEIGRDTHFW